MECDIYGNINDLCWLDEKTIIAVQYSNRRIQKIAIDILTSKCEAEVLDYYTTTRVTCSYYQEAYYDKIGQGLTTQIGIYNSDIDLVRTWKPSKFTGQGRTNTAINSKWTILYNSGSSYVYSGLGRDYQYTISHGEVTYGFTNTFLTRNNIYWGLASTERTFVIRNLTASTTKSVKEDRFKPSDVSGIRDFVFAGGEDKVGVYSEEGTFLKFLETDLADGESFSIIDVWQKQNTILMALYVRPDYEIRIYSVDTSED